jgi:hypothetical protein
VSSAVRGFCVLGSTRLVDRGSRNFNLVICRRNKVTVLRMACELVCCFAHHIIDHVVVLNIKQTHFVQVPAGTVVQVLFGEVLRSIAILEVNESRELLSVGVDSELDLKFIGRRSVA